MSGVKIVCDFETDQIYILRVDKEDINTKNLMDLVAQELKKRLLESSQKVESCKKDYFEYGQNDMKERFMEALLKWDGPTASAQTCLDTMYIRKLRPAEKLKSKKLKKSKKFSESTIKRAKLPKPAWPHRFS